MNSGKCNKMKQEKVVLGSPSVRDKVFCDEATPFISNVKPSSSVDERKYSGEKNFATPTKGMKLIDMKERITFSTDTDQKEDASLPFSKEPIGFIKIRYDGEEILLALPNQESKQLLGPGELALALESAFEIEGHDTGVALELEKGETTHRTIIPLSLANIFQNQISQQESSIPNSLNSEALSSYDLLVRKENRWQPEEDEITSMKTDDVVERSFSSEWVQSGCSKLSTTFFSESITEASDESEEEKQFHLSKSSQKAKLSGIFDCDNFLDGLVDNGEICDYDANLLRDYLSDCENAYCAHRSFVLTTCRYHTKDSAIASARELLLRELRHFGCILDQGIGRACEETSPTRFTVSPITSRSGEDSTPLDIEEPIGGLRSEEDSLDDSNRSFEDLALVFRDSNHLSADLNAEVRVPITMENALDALVEHGRMTVSDRDFLVASFDDSEALKTVYEEFLSSCNSDIFLKILEKLPQPSFQKLEEKNYSAESLATDEEKPSNLFFEQLKNDTVLSALERQNHDVMRYCFSAVFRGDLDIDRLLPSLRYFEKPCRNKCNNA
eukprot:scaffold164071_cov47-Attheya_sp.AAC.2